MKRKLSLIMILALAISVISGCSSEKEYPSKDIQFYVNADAGGGTDSICRKITQIVEGDSDASFYLVNKPGVADSVGPSLAMDAKPDGYTLANVNYGSVVTAVYNEVVEGYSMDRLKPIAMITKESDSIVVSKNAPYKTFEEMIEYAKANPGKIKAGDQGIGSRVYLVLNQIEAKYGVKFNKISYSSSAPQREALLSGEVDMILSSLGDFNALLQNGDGVGIVEFSTERNKAFPDVPTSMELGMDESFLTGSFIYIAAPADTPDEITDYLQDEFEKAVKTDEFQNWTASIGVTPSFMTGDEVSQFIETLQKKDFKALDELKAQGLFK